MFIFLEIVSVYVYAHTHPTVEEINGTRIWRLYGSGTLNYFRLWVKA